MRYKTGDIIKHTTLSTMIKTVIEIRNRGYYCKENDIVSPNAIYPQRYIEKYYVKIGEDSNFKKENHIKKL